jgi:hypothetical protein
MDSHRPNESNITSFIPEDVLRNKGSDVAFIGSMTVHVIEMACQGQEYQKEDSHNFVED